MISFFQMSLCTYSEYGYFHLKIGSIHTENDGRLDIAFDDRVRLGGVSVVTLAVIFEFKEESERKFFLFVDIH